MDIGSSTGGFCDCALQNGAKKVYAIDTGTNQLDKSLKSNKKIQLYENTDFRKINNDIIKNANFITIDVSFISVSKFIEKINELKNVQKIVCLIKPQFECGREIANKYKGIPLNKEVHFEVIKKVISYFKIINYNIDNLTFSPIVGGDGNIEYLAYFIKNGNASNIDFINIIKNAFRTLKTK